MPESAVKVDSWVPVASSPRTRAYFPGLEPVASSAYVGAYLPGFPLVFAGLRCRFQSVEEVRKLGVGGVVLEHHNGGDLLNVGRLLDVRVIVGLITLEVATCRRGT